MNDIPCVEITCKSVMFVCDLCVFQTKNAFELGVKILVFIQLYCEIENNTIKVRGGYIVLDKTKIQAYAIWLLPNQ